MAALYRAGPLLHQHCCSLITFHSHAVWYSQVLARVTCHPRLALLLAGVQAAPTEDISHEDRLKELHAAREQVAELIYDKYPNPILLRIGWHDAASYDKVRAARQPANHEHE